MSSTTFLCPDTIRHCFAQAMSQMYRAEVPQYAQLLQLVERVNSRAAPKHSLKNLELERHGAIRLGSAAELHTMRRLFAVMGMFPVGYYDLSVAGVPVHSTAFRPVAPQSLERNPFRVFTSLLRLELIDDAALREQVRAIVDKRTIFTERTLALITLHEQNGGLTEAQAQEFVAQALHTFRWHAKATVSRETYATLHGLHRLIADVVCFPGPHINHLTPCTVDIDAVQAAMQHAGMASKDVIEGPPLRKCPILLRQTSFQALAESVEFVESAPTTTHGAHTARFGEVEQRGIALTRKGRELYDTLLNQARTQAAAQPAGGSYAACLEQCFSQFPDDLETMRKEELGFFRYLPSLAGLQAHDAALASLPLETLLEQGWVMAQPMLYEDFLPVSAAGIFRSNLGGADTLAYDSTSEKTTFETALGCAVQDEIALYAAQQAQSIADVRAALANPMAARVAA